jgi:hypothetical protein
MGWIITIIVIIVILNIIAHATRSNESSDGKENTNVIDVQDQDNPMFEEIQEEFFDEFEDEKLPKNLHGVSTWWKFRPKPATDSGLNLPPNPEESCRLFRAKPATFLGGTGTGGRFVPE